jgi:hypothetical protein
MTKMKIKTLSIFVILLLVAIVGISGCISQPKTTTPSMPSDTETHAFNSANKTQSDKVKPSKVTLIIWDETDDMPLGNHTKVAGDIVDFYAFYGKDKVPIYGDGITCTISSDLGKAEMEYNEKLKVYHYSFRIKKPGNYSWQVTCDGTAKGYPVLSESDNIEIISRKEELFMELEYFKEVYDYKNDYGLTKPYGAYPRLLKHYMISGWILDEDYKGVNLNRELSLALSRWDYVVVSIYNVQQKSLKEHIKVHKMIKEFNPQTKVLLYIPGGQWPNPSGGAIAGEIIDKVTENNWWVKTPEGKLFPDKPYAWKMINYANDSAAEFMADYISNIVSESDIYDGVELDLIRGERVLRKWFEEEHLRIDLDSNGVDDVSEYGVDWVVNEIQKGYTNVFRKLREKLGDDKIIIGNPGVPWEINRDYNDSELFEYANGNMKEGGEGVNYVVEKGVEGAILNSKKAYDKPERFFIIYLQHPDPDTRGDRKQMRYALTMAMMTDAYFSYDAYDIPNGGHRWHNQIWWWPEYNVNLGFPKSKPKILSDSKGQKYYYREFDNGVVISNNGKKTVEVHLSQRYYDVSTGIINNVFEVEAKDGKILLREMTWQK